MADGELRLILDDETQRRLAENAAARGVSVEAYVLEMIAGNVTSDTRSISKARLAEHRRTGETMSNDEAMAFFDRELEAALARRD